ncbi:MAG: efflux RND transporter permease subunit [Gammaproteobacteria bacterium]|nr:efflux RND transporter permease subunit [Gammaproteobacteria bacterium]
MRSRLEELAKDFPPGLSYRIATDDTDYVADNIKDLQTTILLATALVGAGGARVFLRSPTGTLAVALAIPTSLAAGFAVDARHGLLASTCCPCWR